MTLVLRKDRPWAAHATGWGVAALGFALAEHASVRVFVVGADRLEHAFHTAWITGVVFGAVAACFDEVLGTREFLLQRPLSRGSLVAARLRALLLVLAACVVLAPFAAWFVAAESLDVRHHTRFAALQAIFATYVVAFSGAGIAVAAGSLPAPWWQRLVAAAAWFFATFALVDAFARGDAGLMRMGAFVAGHALVAAAFFAIAAVAARHHADADRPWPQSLRFAAGVPIAAALAVLWAASSSETNSVALLQRAYPTVVELGDTYVLVKGADEERGWFVVDGDHRRTGARVDLRQPGMELWSPKHPWRWSSFGFDAPAWHRGHRDAWGGGVNVLLAADGQAWVRNFQTEMRATGRGEELAPFAAGSSIGDVADTIVVVDAAAGQAWRFDAERGHFVALETPGGDRCEGIAHLRLEDGDPDADLREQIGGEDAGVYPEFVVGRRDGYTVRNGVLVAVPGLLARADTTGSGRPGRARRVPGTAPLAEREEDPFVIEVALPDDGSPVAFRHEFRPRTAEEWKHASLAMAHSLLRSPVLQLAGHLTRMPHDGAWLFDRVVANGRRTWLVLASFVLTAVCAFAFARRLRRLGATRATVRLWTCTIVLLGLPALLVAWIVERPRRYAHRNAAAATAAPRLITPAREAVLA